MGQLATSVAGAAIGFAIGGPAGAQIGWAAGSIAGSILFQETIRNVQPRLQDLKVTTGEYGRPIPYVEGAMRVPGWVAWASERRAIDTTTTVDSKGGPKVENTTTTYEVDMLIILTSHRIAGVRRIWMDGELVWSRAAESDFSTVSASATFARRVTVYTGDEDQLPDPTYEAAVGVGNAPAYRERGSIFIEGLDLGSSGQIRNMTFEVVTGITQSVATEEIATFPEGAGQRFGLSSPEYSSEGLRVMAARWESNTDTAPFRVVEVFDDGEVEYEGSVPLPAYSGVVGTAQGQSDEMLAVMMGTQSNPAGFGQIVRPNGGAVEFNTQISNFNVRDTCSYAIRDGVMYFAVQLSPSDRRVRRYNAAIGGEPTAVSDVLDPDEGLRSIAVANGGQVFVLCQSGAGVTPREIKRLHPVTLAVEETIMSPAIFQGSELLADDAERLHVLSRNDLHRWVSGSTWETVMTGIPDGFGGATQESGVLVFPSLRNGVLRTIRPESGTTYVRAAWIADSLQTIPLDEAVERLHERAGMDLADVDASALASKSLRGFAVTQISTTRTAIEALMAAHFFQAVKDQGIRYVNRGGSPALTIPYEDLGAVEAGGEPQEPLQIIENNDIEIPAYVAVKYANISDDYQEGLEYSDRLITESTETRVVEFAMAMTPTEARQLAQKIANDLQVSKAAVGPLSVQRKYAALQPTDVILVEGRDGLTARMRIDKRDEASGLIKLEGVLDDASVVTGTATTDTDYSGSFTITLPSRTNWDELDIPLMRTVDDGPSFEVAFGAAGAAWRGAVYFGGDDDTSLQQLTAVSTETVTGSCLTALSAWAGGGLQVTGSVEVQVDGELSSITYDQLLAGGNVAAIRSSGRWEILQFQTAELISTGRYRLSGFLRYLKGTEGVTHDIGDRFVLLQTNGIRRIPLTISDLERERVYKAVSTGRQIDSVQSKAFTWTGVKLKPLSPTSVRGNRDATDLVITWARRTRHEDNWLLGSVPLGEETEAYEVDVINGSTVVRTISATSQTATYTAAQQTTDFGSPQSSVTVRVYQLSELVGRGYPAIATI